MINYSPRVVREFLRRHPMEAASIPFGQEHFAEIDGDLWIVRFSWEKFTGELAVRAVDAVNRYLEAA